jgi:hypothetical protein
MTPRNVRRFALGGLLVMTAGLTAGCQGETSTSPALPPSTPAPPPLTGAAAAKANSPLGGSSTAPDPNPGARR